MVDHFILNERTFGAFIIQSNLSLILNINTNEKTERPIVWLIIHLDGDIKSSHEFVFHTKTIAFSGDGTMSAQCQCAKMKFYPIECCHDIYMCIITQYKW